MLLSLQLGLPPPLRMPPRPAYLSGFIHLDPPRVIPLIGGGLLAMDLDLCEVIHGSQNGTDGITRRKGSAGRKRNW